MIPARSGSKGLKDKNIIDVCGKPLIAYTIEAAKESGLFDHIIVSTDSAEYGQISKRYGAMVMYRGEALSNDGATTYMVLEDLLNRLQEPCDYFVLLQPTSPMRDAGHIMEAAGCFERNMENFDFLVSVKPAEHPKELVNKIGSDGSLKYFDADFSGYRRQGYGDCSPNGAIFMAKPDAYREQGHFFGARSLAYNMSKADSVDIDDWMDYQLACICMAKKQKGEEI